MDGLKSSPPPIPKPNEIPRPAAQVPPPQGVTPPSLPREPSVPAAPSPVAGHGSTRINLIPKQGKGLNLFTLGTILFGTSIILFLLAVVLYIQMRGSIVSLKFDRDTQAGVEQQLRESQSRFSDLKGRVDRVARVLTMLRGRIDQHLALTPLFTFLESVTPDEVVFHSFIWQDGNKVILTGEAASFSEVGELLLAFRQSTDVTSSRLTQASAIVASGEEGDTESTRVSFTTEVQFQSALIRVSAPTPSSAS
ncbi:MAG: PilN domain-containing protein [Parcubacteria group bacterium]|nr:PilN domain-containing protein [Parcubacteria group bacterium]